MRAEGAGVGGEIRISEIGRVHESRVAPLLVHADGPVLAVVDDDDHDSEPVPDGGRQLLAGHEEASVAGEGDDGAVRMHRLRGDGRRQPVSHRPAGRA